MKSHFVSVVLLTLVCTTSLFSANYQETLEYKLAIVNSGKGYLPHDHITIARFRYLLDNAAEKTGDTRKAIADLGCKGQRLLREKYGKEVGLLEFMEQVNKLISSANGQKIRYPQATGFAVKQLSE